MVTGRPSTLSFAPSDGRRGVLRERELQTEPLLRPPLPLSAMMKHSFTGPISPNAASRPASSHVYGKLRTNTVVGPPIVA